MLDKTCTYIILHVFVLAMGKIQICESVKIRILGIPNSKSGFYCKFKFWILKSKNLKNRILKSEIRKFEF
jgi:hypothetical protein